MNISQSEGATDCIWGRVTSSRILGFFAVEKIGLLWGNVWMGVGLADLAALGVGVLVIGLLLHVLRCIGHGYLLRKRIASIGPEGTCDPDGITQVPISLWQRYTTGHMGLMRSYPTLVAYHSMLLQTYGRAVVSYFPLGEPTITLTDPKALHQLFTFHTAHLVRLPWFRNSFGASVGNNNLVMINGPAHRLRRKVINPVFNMKNLKEFIPVIVSCFEELSGILDQQQSTVEFQKLSTALTLNVIGRLAISTDFGALNRDGKAHPITKHYNTMVEQCGLSTWGMACGAFPFLRSLPIPYNIARLKARRFAYQHVHGIVKLHLQQQQEGVLIKPSLLHALSSENDAQERAIPLKDIPEELLTFLIAGHETTASILPLIMYTLAQDQSTQEKLFQSLLALSPSPKADELLRAEFLNNFLNESFRYYTPVFLTGRTTTQELVLPLSDGSSLRVPKGIQVLVPMQAIHLDPKVWGADADKFRPERWETIQLTGQDENPRATRTILPFQYIPFFSGPHSCAGRQLALMELRIFVSELVRRYHIQLPTDAADQGPEMDYGLMTKAKAVYLQFRRRQIALAPGANAVHSRAGDATSKRE